MAAAGTPHFQSTVNLLEFVSNVMKSSFFFLRLCDPCYIVTSFFVIKPTRCTNFPNLLCHETLHVSDSSSVHHQELFTVHSAMVYVIQVCRELSSRTRMELFESCLQTCMTYTIAECIVNKLLMRPQELS